MVAGTFELIEGAGDSPDDFDLRGCQISGVFRIGFPASKRWLKNLWHSLADLFYIFHMKVVV
jgi:hypothetical protein